jgi:hypothetical protein
MQFGPPVELSAHQRLCVSGGRFCVSPYGDQITRYKRDFLFEEVW